MNSLEVNKFELEQKLSTNWRTIIAFWLFGLCNNFPHVLMLSAAADIIEKGHSHHFNELENSTCPSDRGTKHCHGSKSIGVILLVDNVPGFITKLLVIFLAQGISYNLRMFSVVALQVTALLIVALSNSYVLALIGVMSASVANGIGGTTILSYSSHFPDSTPVAVASGLGAAGIIGSFLYASLTEPQLANLSPETAILLMLIFPLTLASTFWLILDHPPNLFKKCLKFGSQNVQDYTTNKRKNFEVKETTFIEKLRSTKPFIQVLVPMIIVYLAEYTINQGFIQFIVFDCSNGFGLARISQYRWFQVIYRVGTFITKSSLLFIDFPVHLLYLFPVLQISNGVFFYFEALLAFVPHILIPCLMVFISGLVGGASLTKTYNYVHKTAAIDFKPFLLGLASTSDTFGIFLAAFSSIWFHNFICQQLG